MPPIDILDPHLDVVNERSGDIETTIVVNDNHRAVARRDEHARLARRNPLDISQVLDRLLDHGEEPGRYQQLTIQRPPGIPDDVDSHDISVRGPKGQVPVLP